MVNMSNLHIKHYFMLIFFTLVGTVYATGDFLNELVPINFTNLIYEFECGIETCHGPVTYCTDDKTCAYCNDDICERYNVPSQCQIQCQILRHQKGRSAFEKQFIESTTKKSDTQKETECTDSYIIVLGFTAAFFIITLAGCCIYFKKRNNFSTDTIICFDKRYKRGDSGVNSFQLVTEPENDHLNCNNRNQKAKTVPSGSSLSENYDTCT